MPKSVVSSRIDGGKKGKLIEKADQNGMNASELLEELIDKYLGNELEPEEKAGAKELAPVLSELRELRRRVETAIETEGMDFDVLRERTKEILEEIREAKEEENSLVRLQECDWSTSEKLENLRQTLLNEGKEFVDPKTFEVYTKDEIG